MFKKIFSITLIILLTSLNISYAQTSQEITLRTGFNFISFTNTLSMSPQQFKDLNSSIEDIYLYSSAAGSFLSLKEGTLSTLSAGKGYIVKSLSKDDILISVTGALISSIDNVNLLNGFNLVGFSKVPTNITFETLMTTNTIIQGIYKWSSAAGSFISVVRNNLGTIEKLDSADPIIRAGESYFIKLYANSTLNYNESQINFTPSTYTITPADSIPAESLTDIPLPERIDGAGNIAGKITLPSTTASSVYKAISITSVSDIKVWIKNHPEINAKTDTNGEFILKNVPKALKDNGHTLEYEKIEGTDKFNGIIENIPVVENKQIDISKYVGPLVIKKSAVIQGKIELADGLSPLGAEAYIAGISAMLAKADDDGSFSLLDVPAGTFNIIFQAYGYEISRQTLTVEANQIKQLPTIQLKKLTPITTVGDIDGYVLAEDGSPIAGAIVSIISEDKSIDIGAIASATGHYKFSNITAGKYKLIFLKDCYKGSEKEILINSGTTINHNQTMTKISTTQTTSAFGLITGLVKDSTTGAPIRNAVVLTVPPTRQFYTDYNGYFDFLIQPGAYTLKIQKTGYNEEQISIIVEADKVKELSATLQSKTGTAIVTSLALNYTTLTINVGDTLQLTATAKDSAENILSGKPIVWATTDSTVCEVTQSGLVTSKKEGTCSITASIDGKIATMTLNSKLSTGSLVKSLKIFPENLSLKLNDIKLFVIFATYEDGSSKIIPNSMAQWTTSSNCLTMQDNGSILATSSGTAIVTAQFNNFSSNATVEVIDSGDLEPPTISHSFPIYETDKDLTITAGVTDNVAIAKVWLNFCAVGAAEYIKVEMTKNSFGKYYYNIPATLITPKGLNYFIIAEDTKLPTPNKSTFPAYGLNKPVTIIPPPSPLNSLQLSQTSEIIMVNEVFNISKIKVIAKYNDNTTKEVNVTWLSNRENIINNAFITPTSQGNITLISTYTENNVTKTASFILSVKEISSLTLSKNIDLIYANQTYDLSKILTYVIMNPKIQTEI